MKRNARPGRHASQHGAALLTAMIIVTLVATLASSMIWQQWRAVQVETAERARAQSAWILTGALDWARLILREDARSGGADHLGEPWAVPLAEARLSTFLAADRDNADDAPQAFLSGAIADAQARYNLRNLIDQNKVVQAEQQVLERLCETAGVTPDVAGRIAAGLLKASQAEADSADAPLMPHSVAELVWLDIDADAVQRLAPYVVLLPARTAVNVNTASREVLAAVIDDLDLASAERLVQVRQRTPFRGTADVTKLLPGAVPPAAGRIGIGSNFFEITGRLRLERKGLDIVPLRRERVNHQDAGT
jgi:general secretion pathway protein K